MWILDIVFGAISFLAILVSVLAVGVEKKELGPATTIVAAFLYRIAVLLWLMRILGVLLLIPEKIG
jgi:hypothetical protein